MNPNEMMAQQQAMLNQAMQTAQHMQIAYIAFSVALLLVAATVLYAFYARLRGIEQEIMRFRIAYEFANKRKSQGAPLRSSNPGSESSIENLFTRQGES